jgi:2-phospho-L-lactate/phosphoenolpyruvate guanylyltransferase
MARFETFPKATMTADSGVWAVVPVKQFAAAKSRLNPVLDPSERAELARLMLEDVLEALTSCRRFFAGVLVVTSDRTAAEVARCYGARTIQLPRDGGINCAIMDALQAIDTSLHDGLMVVPSDIPQVTHNAFAEAAAAIALPHSLAIAAAAEDNGTNLLACRPANAITPRFGMRSFDQHCVAARRTGVAVHTLSLPELSFDIDRPKDLRTFLALESDTRTHAFLACNGIVARLERYLRPSRTQPLSGVVREVMS